MRRLCISIHAPREGGDDVVPNLTLELAISIHAPREGGDLVELKPIVAVGISIHAPREGGDCHMGRRASHAEDFNPRPPRGGRRIHPIDIDRIRQFQSTPPARGATPSSVLGLCFGCYFNPRPPRGGRQHWCDNGTGHDYFNPRPPRGGRPLSSNPHLSTWFISIHAPREGGDKSARAILPPSLIFQSTPPARGATPAGTRRVA